MLYIMSLERYWIDLLFLNTTANSYYWLHSRKWKDHKKNNLIYETVSLSFSKKFHSKDEKVRKWNLSNSRRRFRWGLERPRLEPRPPVGRCRRSTSWTPRHWLSETEFRELEVRGTCKVVPNLPIKWWPVLGQCLFDLILEKLVLGVIIFLQLSIYFARNLCFWS